MGIDVKTDDAENHSAELLLSEFSNLTTLFSNSEEQGDRRVSIFLTVASLLTGAFGISVQFGASGAVIMNLQAGVLMTSVLISLFIFGIFTLARLSNRNTSSDDYKIKLGKLRAYFTKNNKELYKYLPFGETDEIDILRQRITRWPHWYKPGSGGYIQTVALLNSILVGLAIIILFSSIKDFGYYYVGLGIGVAVAVALQYFQHYFIIRELRKKLFKLKVDNLSKFTVNGPYEEEVSLIVYSDDAKRDFDRIIEDIPKINHERFIHKFAFTKERNKITIEDIYYDTNDLKLDKKMIVLRVRKENSNKVDLTLKGETKQRGTDIPERVEITCKWSDTGLKQILKELNQMLKTSTFNISALKFVDDFEQQEVVMKSVGLERVQKRISDRTQKMVKVRKGRFLKQFAEIDFDDVSVEFEKNKIRYYNVEVELKSLNKKETSRDEQCKSMDNDNVNCNELEEKEEFREHIKEVTERMVLHFCPFLVRWKHSKFATFNALKALDDETLTNTDGSLKKDSFRKIDNFIRNIHQV